MNSNLFSSTLFNFDSRHDLRLIKDTSDMVFTAETVTSHFDQQLAFTAQTVTSHGTVGENFFTNNTLESLLDT